MTSSERSEVKVVVFLADLDPAYNNRTSEVILNQYDEEVRAGLVTILRVLPEYYPPLVGLHRNFGDSVTTVKVIVRPLSTVGYTSVVASVIHSRHYRQWSNYLNS